MLRNKKTNQTLRPCSCVAHDMGVRQVQQYQGLEEAIDALKDRLLRTINVADAQSMQTSSQAGRRP